MENKLSNRNQTIFGEIRETDKNGNEFWMARKLSKILEYAEFRNFLPVIEWAKEACRNSKQIVENHFVDYHEMVSIGSGTERKMESIKLSRYACYLVVQNADPGKEIVALGQTYFAVQTRLQEIQQMLAFQQLKTEEDKRLFLRKEMSEHNKHLADAAKGAGVIEPG